MCGCGLGPSTREIASRSAFLVSLCALLVYCTIQWIIETTLAIQFSSSNKEEKKEKKTKK